MANDFCKYHYLMIISYSILITNCADCPLEHHRRMADCLLHRCGHQPVWSDGLHDVWPRNGAALGRPHILLSWRLRQKTSARLVHLTNLNHQLDKSQSWAYTTGNFSERCSSCADNSQSTAN